LQISKNPFLVTLAIKDKIKILDQGLIFNKIMSQESKFQDTEVIFQELNLKMFLVRHMEKQAMHQKLNHLQEESMSLQILNIILL
jgi:hypothetical protein